MPSKKSQSSLEFIMLTGFMMIVFVIFFAIAADKIAEMTKLRNDKVAQEIYESVMAELTMAQSSLDGYSRDFTLPPTIEGVQYEITLFPVSEENVMIIFYSDKEYKYELPVELSGYNTVYKGTNHITKQNGKITVTNGADPCYSGSGEPGDEKVNIAGDKSYCIGGLCYCYSGHYAPEGVCDHENDFDLGDECYAGCLAFDHCNPPPAILPGDEGEIGITPSDTKANLAFRTNESARALVRYDRIADGVCPAWDAMANEVSTSGFKRIFEGADSVLLAWMHADTEYCFRLAVNDSKGAWQEYSYKTGESLDVRTSWVPQGSLYESENAFRTASDISPPVVRIADVVVSMGTYGGAVSDSYILDYGQPFEINASIIEDTGIQSVDVIISQRINSGMFNVTRIPLLDNTDGACALVHSTFTEEFNDVPPVFEYLNCLKPDYNFARNASYDQNEPGVLFYARYDDILDADFAKGSKAPISPNLISEDIVPARFGNGVKITSGTPGKILRYSALDNINIENGTIEFWLKPQWSGDIVPKTFFYAEGGNKMIFYRIGDYVYFTIGSIDRNREIRADLPLNDWHFVTLMWDKDSMEMYIDGELEGRFDDDGDIPLSGLNDFYIGYSKLWIIPSEYYADSIIDQFRILGRKINPAQVKADFETEKAYYLHFETQDDDGRKGSFAPGGYSGISSFRMRGSDPQEIS